MEEILIRNVVQREKDYSYYVDKYGNVCRAKIDKKVDIKNYDLGKVSEESSKLAQKHLESVRILGKKKNIILLLCF